MTLHEVEPATVALIHDGRVKESIAQNNFAGIERRANDFPHELRARGVHEQQLRFGSHVAIRGAVLEKMADFLADRSAAGFAQNNNILTELGKPLSEPFDLRGFAAAFGALERDEYPHIPNYHILEMARRLICGRHRGRARRCRLSRRRRRKQWLIAGKFDARLDVRWPRDDRRTPRWGAISDDRRRNWRAVHTYSRCRSCRRRGRDHAQVRRMRFARRKFRHQIIHE